MAALLNTALLLVLGVLQVSTQKDSTAAIVVVEEETKCFQRNSEWLETSPYVIARLEESQTVKLTLIERSKVAREAIEKCICGKEAVDKKCREEVDSAMHTLLSTVKGIYDDFLEPFLTTLDQASLLAGASLNELQCCCPKIHMCVEKYNHAVLKSPENKECKTEKCYEPYVRLFNVLDAFISTLQVAYDTVERLIRDMKEVSQSEEEFLKGEKCKDEKNAAMLGERLRRVDTELNNYRLIMTIINWADERRLFLYSEQARKECASCGKGK